MLIEFFSADNSYDVFYDSDLESAIAYAENIPSMIAFRIIDISKSIVVYEFNF